MKTEINMEEKSDIGFKGYEVRFVLQVSKYICSYAKNNSVGKHHKKRQMHQWDTREPIECDGLFSESCWGRCLFIQK